MRIEAFYEFFLRDRITFHLVVLGDNGVHEASDASEPSSNTLCFFLPEVF